MRPTARGLIAHYKKVNVEIRKPIKDKPGLCEVIETINRRLYYAEIGNYAPLFVRYKNNYTLITDKDTLDRYYIMVYDMEAS